MKPTINCITLPVDDLRQSFKFYRDGLGLLADEPDESSDHVAFTLDGKLYLVILLRHEFRKFTELANQDNAAKGSSECIVSYFTSNKEEVDIILKNVEKAGGVSTGNAVERPWGYAGYFKDPDDHLWEIMWNPAL
ncbi:MAG: VOC family protein [Chitinophagaceae bacterium]|nr:VOC family protein [Chitinophagaceae bacterium]